MGDEIATTENTILKIAAPQTARFVVFRNGEQIFQSDAVADAQVTARERGTYRAEVYLDSLDAPFDRMPWIISNPIYVK